MTTPSYTESPREDPGATGSGRGASTSSIGALFSEVSQDLSTLMRQELELAKAELRQSATRAGKGAGMLGGAALGGYMTVLFLTIALWWWIGSGLGLGWSALIVAGIWAVIAAALGMIGKKEVSSVQGLPRTTETTKQIPDALKGNEENR